MADVLKNMTLRGLDPQLAAKLREVAEREGKSVNHNGAGRSPKAIRNCDKSRRFTEVYHDLDLPVRTLGRR